MSGYTIASASYLRTYFNGYGYYNVKTSKLKIYLRPFNAYAVQFYDTFQRTRIPLTGRYLIYELTKVQQGILTHLLLIFSIRYSKKYIFPPSQLIVG